MAVQGVVIKAALKAVGEVLQNPSESKEKGKKIISMVGMISISLILIPALALSVPNLFGKGEEIDFNVELTQTKIYQDIYSAYLDYQAGVQAEIQSRISAMRAANEAAYNAAKKKKEEEDAAKKTLFLENGTGSSDLIYRNEKTNLITTWSDGDLIGEFEITGYCPCASCCGKWANGITSTGVQATHNHTIAVDPKVIPYSTWVRIEGVPGVTFRAEDCGGAIKNYRIDRYFNTHQEALIWGRKKLRVYYVSGPSSTDQDGIGGGLPTQSTGGRSSSQIAYSLAYISIKHQDKQTKADNFKLSKAEVKKFYDDITTIKVWQTGSYPNESYDHSITVLDEYQIAKKFFTSDEEQQKYIFSYETYYEIVANEATFTDFPLDFSELVFSDVGMQIPLYLQWDSRWGKTSYGLGDRTISSSGCAPTSMAMVETYLTGTAVSPIKPAQWSFQNGYGDKGTDWSFFPAYSKTIGIKCEVIGVNASKIVAALKAEKPVIISMGPGTFTSDGHFIVLRGMSADGNIYVNDPNDNSTKNHFNKAFPLEQIIKEARFPDGSIKSAWAFSN